MEQYFGTYQTFETMSKKDAGMLLGADNLVGDRYRIDIELENGVHKAWLTNRFDKRIGYFPSKFSRRLSVLQAQGFTLTATLALIAYTDNPEPGFYWGEMAVVCYNPAHAEAFERFLQTVSERLADGVRPHIDFESEAVAHIIDSNGTWVPEQTAPLPKKEKGTVLMKTKRTLSEKMVEEGRKGNKGCYVVSWAFIIALVAVVIFVIKCFT